jgi:superfamily II DNA or RNA helicase
MSVLLKWDDIPLKKKEKLADHLYVTPLSKEVFNPRTKRVERQKYTGDGVEAIDIFDEDNVKMTSVPFSYWYHHLSDVQPLSSTIQRTSQNFRFPHPLLERQKAIREETFEIINRTRSVMLCLHTGFGKTIYTLYLLSKIGLKAVIMCHRSIIIEQWCQSIHKYLPDATYEVMTTKKDFKDVDILICNVINVPKIDKYKFAKFGVVVVDEIHTICTEKFIKCLNPIFPDYLIGLSATPFRTDGMDRLIELYVGPEIVYRPMWRVFNSYKFKTGFKPKVEYQSDGKINWNSVLSSQTLDDSRNRMVVGLVHCFCKRNILILVKLRYHATLLKEMILSQNPNESVSIFMGSDKIVDFSSRVLIVTTSKGGVGFDHPKLDMLITAADVEQNFMQYLGRVFRRDDVSPIYVDMIDDNNTINKHATTRKKVVEEVGGTMYDFERVFSRFFRMIQEYAL